MKLVFKGIIIGIGKILPGISGSVLAMSMGEYKNIIISFNNLKDNKNVIYLTKICIGIIISVVLISKLLFKYIDIYKFYMFAFFIGLILGTVPSMIKKVDKKNILLVIIGFISLSIISFVKVRVKLSGLLCGIINGIIESISTIVPGISGTAIMGNLGLYKVYLLGWSNMFNLSFIAHNLAYFISFWVCMIITSIIILKLFNYYYLKYEEKLNGLFLGFVLASLLLLFKSIDIINIFIFIILIIVGFLVSYVVEKL